MRLFKNGPALPRDRARFCFPLPGSKPVAGVLEQRVIPAETVKTDIPNFTKLPCEPEAAFLRGSVFVRGLERGRLGEAQAIKPNPRGPKAEAVPTYQDGRVGSPHPLLTIETDCGGSESSLEKKFWLVNKSHSAGLVSSIPYTKEPFWLTLCNWLRSR